MEMVLNYKALLNVKEVCEYLNWGENTVRNILKRPKNSFTVRQGNRLYANKKRLDEWIDAQTGK